MQSSPTASDSVSVKPAFPFLDLKAQYRAIKDEVELAIQRVMESQHFILGPEVESLEREVASYSETRLGVSCASGSDALLLALMALEVGSDHEVITTPFTFVATAGAIARLGARPVFVDIDPASFNLDPSQLERVIGPRTKAIIPVHLFGMAADMDPIVEIAKRRGIAVVEDAAQAIGATYSGRRVGSIGLCGCFSFYPSKNLGAAGDGGMLVTNDSALADTFRLLRNHGSRSRYEYEVIGMNSRLDALQAAVLRVKLQHLEGWAKARQRVAAQYAARFKNRGLDGVITLPQVAPQCTHVYNQFVIRAPKRDQLIAHMRERGVPTEIYYPLPLQLQPAFAYLGHKAGDLPRAEAASREVLAIPIYPEMADNQQALVVDSIASFYRG